MSKPPLKTSLASILAQRAALAEIRAEAEDLDDYLAALEARARDTGKRIPMAMVHLKLKSRPKTSAR